MLLCPVQRVLDDLGFDISNMPNITKATVAALNIAEQSLANSLGTVFLQQTITDQWFVRHPQMTYRANVRTTFKLRQGFVDPTVPLIGTMFQKTGQIFTAVDGGYNDYEIIPTQQSADVSVNMAMLRTQNDATGYEKGIVVDQTNYYYSKWISITYKAGFPVGPNDPLGKVPAYDLTVVPQWLQTCAHMKARIILQSNPSLQDPSIKLDNKMMQSELDILVSGHARYAPEAMLPDA